VRPPAIWRASAREWRSSAAIIHGSGETPPFKNGVKHNLEVLRVQLVNHLFRLGKVRWMPGELSVVRVPPRGREVGAQIDERIAGQLFVAEGARHPLDFVRPVKRAMRLQVAERPQRGHLWMASQARIFTHYLRWLASSHDKDVERQRVRGIDRNKTA